MPPTTSGRGRPRLESTDQRIFEAARELLRLRGPAAVNIDSVAARSGVARTTIYRRYRSRDELMHAILEHLIDPAPLAPDLPVGEKLRWVMERISDILENRLGPGATAAIIADSDPEFSTAVRSRLATRLSSLADHRHEGRAPAADDRSRHGPRRTGRRLPRRGPQVRLAAQRLDGSRRELSGSGRGEELTPARNA